MEKVMNTKNSKLKLMMPHQINKDVVFNEAINKIDHLLHRVIRLVSKLPDKPTAGQLYMVHSASKTTITYYNNGWHEFDPIEGNYYFIKELGQFATYHQGKIVPLYNNLSSNFINARGEYKISSLMSKVYLDITADLLITSAPLYQDIAVYIANNSEEEYKIRYADNIKFPIMHEQEFIIKPGHLLHIVLYPVAQQGFILARILGEYQTDMRGEKK